MFAWSWSSSGSSWSGIRIIFTLIMNTIIILLIVQSTSHLLAPLEEFWRSACHLVHPRPKHSLHSLGSSTASWWLWWNIFCLKKLTRVFGRSPFRPAWLTEPYTCSLPAFAQLDLMFVHFKLSMTVSICSTCKSCIWYCRQWWGSCRHMGPSKISLQPSKSNPPPPYSQLPQEHPGI